MEQQNKKIFRTQTSISFSIPLLKEIDQAAYELNISRSEFVNRACKEKLSKCNKKRA